MCGHNTQLERISDSKRSVIASLHLRLPQVVMAPVNRMLALALLVFMCIEKKVSSVFESQIELLHHFYSTFVVFCAVVPVWTHLMRIISQHIPIGERQ